MNPYPPWICTALSARSEEHTSELQSQSNLVCRLLLEKKKKPHARWLGNSYGIVGLLLRRGRRLRRTWSDHFRGVSSRHGPARRVTIPRTQRRQIQQST